MGLPIDLALIVQLFILINPLSSFSVLLAAYKNKMDVKKIAYNSVLIAFVLAIIIALIGPYVFQFFGITIDSFRVAGGLVLLLLGIETIRSKHEKKEVGKIDSLISIVATPLLTGPATISFIVIKSYEISRFSLLMNIFVSFIIVGFVFVLFSHTLNKINAKVISITSRVLGLFLTAMAIEMIVSGILNIVKTV
jgi:multiple antibiotic resistance protein